MAVLIVLIVGIVILGVAYMDYQKSMSKTTKEDLEFRNYEISLLKDAIKNMTETIQGVTSKDYSESEQKIANSLLQEMAKKAQQISDDVKVDDKNN